VGYATNTLSCHRASSKIKMQNEQPVQQEMVREQCLERSHIRKQQQQTSSAKLERSLPGLSKNSSDAAQFMQMAM
jgi:hypothetical protein